MSLDAWVSCDCYERGLIAVPEAFAGRISVEADGLLILTSSEPKEQLQFDRWRRTACQHEGGMLLHHCLGNIAGVAELREALQGVSPAPELVLGRVVYNGIHCGDLIAVEELSALRAELEALRSFPSEEVARLVARLFELLQAAESVRKPICF